MTKFKSFSYCHQSSMIECKCNNPTSNICWMHKYFYCWKTLRNKTPDDTSWMICRQ